jgi:PhnB protein
MKLNPYLNFMGKTEEAFNFYKSVFGGEFIMLQKFKDVADMPEKANMTAEDLEKVMHVALKVGDNTLMATDALESMGHTLTLGNNISLSLNVDSREEADRLYAALSVGGKIELPMQDMFWGTYFGILDDQFGIKWMVNYEVPKQ